MEFFAAQIVGPVGLDPSPLWARATTGGSELPSQQKKKE